MDDLIITLPCGFTSPYKDIFDNKDKFSCPYCKNHLITGQECLNMTKNKLLIKEKNFELKTKNFIELIQSVRMANNDPKSSIDNTFENLKNQIDLRREQVKLIIEKKIDDYYENLLETIENEKKQNLDDFNDHLEQTLALEQELNNLSIKNITDVNYKINIIEQYCDRIDDETKILKNESKLNSTSWIFNEGDDNIEIENIFGSLEWKEEINQNIENENAADFCFLVENFSIFKDMKNSLRSKVFKVLDLEWEVLAKINENTFNEKTLGFYLECLSINDSNDIKVNVNAEFRLLHFSEKIKDSVAKIENMYEKGRSTWGFHNFFTINEIMNKNGGFYDINKDRVTLEIRIYDADIYLKNMKC